jgi:hypothetical protein
LITNHKLSRALIRLEIKYNSLIFNSQRSFLKDRDINRTSFNRFNKE